MLDTKFIREHAEEVKENIKNRHAKADVDAFVALDNQRREILQKVEAMKNERNTVTKEISQLKRNKEKRFASYFKKYQFISLTNFGTAFGMGLLVIVFMASEGFYAAPIIGLLGACCGCVVSTRLMQRFVLKAYPNYEFEDAVSPDEIEDDTVQENASTETTPSASSVPARANWSRSSTMSMLPVLTPGCTS